MAALKKLQAEIDKTLKKVDEGLEEFKVLWENVQHATTSNQREKLEGELKSHIKKLQREREQIKNWLGAKEIKDKGALLDARKRIEAEMERFKEFERDSKTKAFSKEGLNKVEKSDPHEEEIKVHSKWIQEAIDALKVQNDELEADVEQQYNVTKRRVLHTEVQKLDQLKATRERHQSHIKKLEQLRRKVDNDEVCLTEVEDVKDLVEFYVQQVDSAGFDFGGEEDAISRGLSEKYESFNLDAVVEVAAAATVAATKEPWIPETDPPVRENRVKEKKKKDSIKEAVVGLPRCTVPRAASPTAKVRSSENIGVRNQLPTTSVWMNPTPLSAPTTTEAAHNNPPSISVPLHAPPAHPVANSDSTANGTAAPPTVPRVAPPTAPPTMPPAAPLPTAAKGAGFPHAPQLLLGFGNPPPIAPPYGPPVVPPTAPPSGPPLLPPTQPPTAPPSQPPNPPTAPPAQPLNLPPNPPPTGPPNMPPTLPPTAPPQAPPNLPPPTLFAQLSMAPPNFAPPSIAPPTQPPCLQPSSAMPHTQAECVPPSDPPPPPPVAKGPPPSAAHPPPPSGPPPPPRTASAVPPNAPPSPPPRVRVGTPPSAPPGVPLGTLPSAPPGAPPSVPLAALLDSRISVSDAAPAGTSTSQVSGQTAQQDGEPVPPSVSAPRQTEKGRKSASRRGFHSPEKIHVLKLLEQSYSARPTAPDRTITRQYRPRNPYVHLNAAGQSLYPTQPCATFDSQQMFEKYDLDTLFFIFYYQQGTYHQHLAAKELKKLSWRYHTKYLTWFQRHEEPRVTTTEFERGAYVYFDYDAGWCQRMKTDFTFEYKYLEDEFV